MKPRFRGALDKFYEEFITQWNQIPEDDLVAKTRFIMPLLNVEASGDLPVFLGEIVYSFCNQLGLQIQSKSKKEIARYAQDLAKSYAEDFRKVLAGFEADPVQVVPEASAIETVTRRFAFENLESKDILGVDDDPVLGNMRSPLSIFNAVYESTLKQTLLDPDQPGHITEIQYNKVVNNLFQTEYREPEAQNDPKRKDSYLPISNEEYEKQFQMASVNLFCERFGNPGFFTLDADLSPERKKLAMADMSWFCDELEEVTEQAERSAGTDPADQNLLAGLREKVDFLKQYRNQSRPDIVADRIDGRSVGYLFYDKEKQIYRECKDYLNTHYPAGDQATPMAQAALDIMNMMDPCRTQSFLLNKTVNRIENMGVAFVSSTRWFYSDSEEYGRLERALITLGELQVKGDKNRDFQAYQRALEEVEAAAENYILKKLEQHDGKTPNSPAGKTRFAAAQGILDIIRKDASIAELRSPAKVKSEQEKMEETIRAFYGPVAMTDQQFEKYVKTSDPEADPETCNICQSRYGFSLERPEALKKGLSVDDFAVLAFAIGNAMMEKPFQDLEEHQDYLEEYALSCHKFQGDLIAEKTDKGDYIAAKGSASQIKDLERVKFATARALNNYLLEDPAKGKFQGGPDMLADALATGIRQYLNYDGVHNLDPLSAVSQMKARMMGKAMEFLERHQDVMKVAMERYGLTRQHIQDMRGIMNTAKVMERGQVAESALIRDSMGKEKVKLTPEMRKAYMKDVIAASIVRDSVNADSIKVSKTKTKEFSDAQNIEDPGKRKLAIRRQYDLPSITRALSGGMHKIDEVVDRVVPAQNLEKYLQLAPEELYAKDHHGVYQINSEVRNDMYLNAQKQIVTNKVLENDPKPAPEVNAKAPAVNPLAPQQGGPGFGN